MPSHSFAGRAVALVQQQTGQFGFGVTDRPEPAIPEGATSVRLIVKA